MPNHVATIMVVEGGTEAERAEFLKDITVEKNEFDLNKLLKRPEILSQKGSPIKIVTEEEYKELQESNSPQLYQAMTEEQSKNLIAEYGADNWYDWMINNWGTKWGIYDLTCESELKFSYNTAWSPATTFYINISTKYPSLTFYHEFADEGGFFVGYERIQDGVIKETADYKWESENGVEIRKRVRGWYEDEDENEDTPNPIEKDTGNEL